MRKRTIDMELGANHLVHHLLYVSGSLLLHVVEDNV